MTGIYKIYWPNCDYFYIGQSVKFKGRKATHLSELKLNKHCNERLQRTYNKYGIPEIEIIEECSINDLDKREQYYIDIHIKESNFCNLSPTSNSTRGYKHTEATKDRLKSICSNAEYREKQSKRMMGHKFNVGKKHSDETKRKMSDAKKGYVPSEKSVALFKERCKQYKGEGHPMYGTKFSKETRQKITDSRIGSKNPNYGKIAVNARKVIDSETGYVFPSVRETAKYHNMNYGTLKDKLSGRIKNNTKLTYVK